MKKIKNKFNGAIIEESLINTEVLKRVTITKTSIIPVTERHKTPWIKQWTFHYVEVNEDEAESIAEEISISIDREHAWYADFKNEKVHYVVYKNKVFKIDRSNKEDYKIAITYGNKLGIPNYQLDFSPFHKLI